MLANLQASAAKDGGMLGQYWTEWQHISSNFVSVAVGMATTALPDPLRLYLPLLFELLWKLPCTDDNGATLSKDDFVSELQNETVK